VNTGAGIDEWVARRLRELRAERGITLSALAAQVGISAPHLSRLEKGERQPSIGTLLQIARVYGVTVSHLVEELDDADHHVVRAADAVGHQGLDGRYTVLSGPRADISVVRLELVPGKATKPARHAGEEWLHVVAGSVEFIVDDETTVLGPGDSVHFDSAHPHRLFSAEAATVLIASTAPTAAVHHPIPGAGPRRKGLR
jgi:transcriptional regulator with XRE-family HTH domain